LTDRPGGEEVFAMALEITVTHEGGKRIDARFLGFTVHTDQSPDGGGEGSAPEPFMYFLASLATCAGIYVVGFCRARDIPTDGIRLVQDHSFDEKTGRLIAVKLTITVPTSFPEKYVKALERVASICTVKRTIENPPEFMIESRVEG
jgi:ribosomal protein S12 methylthiotransferase accessory factor